jgi:predicted nucleic acid-binding protein
MTKDTGAIVVDANIAIALAAREATRHPILSVELDRYTANGYRLFAPNVIVSESLYILCGKHRSGTLTAKEYGDAVTELALFLSGVSNPTDGDSTLIARAAAIGEGYGCSRSADSLYIALAEELATTVPTILLTFDADLPNQAARNAPTVTVRLLTP